ncbi:MAG: isoprenylcysteine carboxyl methyltransferase [Myxococcota bacterium]|nr:isoprenylcysteine carboxyl methyltransferase [Myxococcota bacterium]
MDSRAAFTILVIAVALQRLWELRRSARHEARIRAAGGREHAPAQMPWMRALHASWLVAMLVEVWVLSAAFDLTIAIGAGALFVIGQALRLAAMHQLGWRWTVKVMTVPGEKAVASGIFRHVRHPNYLGVILEIAALPLIHGAWLTSFVYTVANAALLRARIAAEERALREDSDYDALHEGRPRFVPGLHGR